MNNYDLNTKSRIWVHPGSDLKMTYDYGEDRSGASITLQYREREWAHMPHQYSTIEPDKFEDSDPEIDTSDLGNGIVTILIGPDTIEKWVDRMLEMQLVTNHNNRQWSHDFTVTVAQGA